MNSVEYLLLSANDGRAEHEILRRLRDRDADRLHRAGQASLRRVDAVLDVDGGQVGIAGQVER